MVEKKSVCPDFCSGQIPYTDALKSATISILADTLGTKHAFTQGSKIFTFTPGDGSLTVWNPSRGGIEKYELFISHYPTKTVEKNHLYHPWKQVCLWDLQRHQDGSLLALVSVSMSIKGVWGTGRVQCYSLRFASIKDFLRLGARFCDTRGQ